MIAHVGKGQPRWNAQAPRRGSQQRRFRDAESSFSAQAIARPEVTSRLSPIIGVVEDFVAHRVVQLHGARHVVVSTCRNFSRKLLDARVAAVNKLRWRQVWFEFHRTPPSLDSTVFHSIPALIPAASK